VPDNPSFEKEEGDSIGFYLPPRYTLEAMGRVTHSYADVMAADEVTLRQWFAGRTVVIGNFTEAAADYDDDAQGRRWYRPYGHAQAIESLTRNYLPQVTTKQTERVVAGGGAMLGLAAGLAIAFTRRKRLWLWGLSAAVVFAGLSLALSMVLYSELMMLFNPLGVFAAMLAALTIGLMSRRWTEQTLA
jgi:hypothetical protein